MTQRAIVLAWCAAVLSLPNAFGFQSDNSSLTRSFNKTFGFGGRQWFALTTRSEHEWEEGVRKAQPVLEAFILAEAARHKLPLSSVALVGFSQGTMMALHTGLPLKEAPAAIVGFLGHLAGAGRLQAEMKCRPARHPVSRHRRRGYTGSGDPPCQFGACGGRCTGRMARQADLGHGIDPEGLMLAGQFLRSAFGLDAR